MTQIATVKKLLEEKKAEITVVRQSACSHDCSTCGGCGPTESTKVDAVADNLVGARPGDTVRVESDSGKVLGLAAVFYLIPLVLFFVGYFVAQALGLSEGLCLLAGVLLGAASFLIAWLVDRRLKANSVRMKIVEVLHCSDM
ncbi:MAG: SoxR reducing system RseC family protein [Oscillospiraceae bacterium]|nr:SoxR reducing system RseC family protein [Oscillospiraceae bacterium]